MLVALAEKGEVINTADLGDKMRVSPKYLRKLAGPLEKYGLIKSVQGIYGGYLLNRKPEAISLVDIFEAFGEKVDITGCSANESCPIDEECLTRPLWAHLKKIVEDEFHKITVKKIVERELTS